MDISFYLGAYWWNWKESVEEGLDRSVGFFQELASCDESLAHWFQLGRSRKDALRRPVDLADRKGLLRLWKRGIELWNGAEDDQSIGLGISCGGYTPRVPNSVVINLSRDLGPLAAPDKIQSVLVAVAQAWEPEWAGVRSHEATESRPFETGKPLVDWMLYLSRALLPRSTTVHLPNQAIVLPKCLGSPWSGIVRAWC